MTSLLADLWPVAESRLTEELRAQLPDSAAPPPWTCRVRAVVWVQRGRPALPPGSPYDVRPVTVGAVVDYLQTPVGPYREVLAGVLLRRRPSVHVPFIAVDSLPSVVGGRVNWGLPKVLARFSGEVDDGGAHGDGWSVGVVARPVGPTLPLRARSRVDQVAGRTSAQVRGRGRLARVDVSASGPTLTGWLGGGTRAGVVVTGRVVVHPPR